MQITRQRIYNPKLQLPKVLGRFLLRLVCLTLAWEMCYNFILKQARVPDKILTDLLTRGVTGSINFFFTGSLNIFITGTPHAVWIENAMYPANAIQQNGKSVFYIFDNCNGLDLIVIYLGFIILLPNTVKRKIAFGLIGITGLILLNICRCVLLYWIYMNHPNHFEINHHYIFTLTMYLFIFYGWVLFTKKEKLSEH